MILLSKLCPFGPPSNLLVNTSSYLLKTLKSGKAYPILVIISEHISSVKFVIYKFISAFYFRLGSSGFSIKIYAENAYIVLTFFLKSDGPFLSFICSPENKKKHLYSIVSPWSEMKVQQCCCNLLLFIIGYYL